MSTCQWCFDHRMQSRLSIPLAASSLRSPPLLSPRSSLFANVFTTSFLLCHKCDYPVVRWIEEIPLYIHPRLGALMHKLVTGVHFKHARLDV